MGKEYWVVAADAGRILSRRKYSKLKQMFYSKKPEDRANFVMANIACFISTLGLILLMIGVFHPFTSSPIIYIIVGLMPGAHIIYASVATLIDGIRGDKKVQMKQGIRTLLEYEIPWLDPYGLARDAVDVPGKKTYFVVDSERNAVVDVIHLGKWGQKWLNHRAKRQAAKATE